MIKQGFLKKQVQKSKKIGNTTRVLSEFVLFVADEVLRKHYGDNYSIYCHQSSFAIQTILREIGIKSTLWGEHLCVSEVFKNSNDISWGGFWDETHHVWLCTEFSEIVDLTISQLYLHPSVQRDDIVKIPAIWWHDVSSWPNTIRYLPTKRVEPLWDENLKIFQKSVKLVLSDILNNYTIHSTKFGPILFGQDSMNELHAKGNPWLVKTLPINQNGYNFPLWIQNKENELREICMNNKSSNKCTQADQKSRV